MDLKDAEDFCNRIVPIYLVREKAPVYPPESLLYALHNYLYQRWFVPYQSNIEYGQFLAKVIIPHHLPSISASDASGVAKERLASITKLHNVLCTRVREIKQATSEQPGLHKKTWSERTDTEFVNHQEFFILQSIFRAIIIIFPAENYNLLSPEIGQTKVFLIITGVTEGLSELITFDPIIDRIDNLLTHSIAQLALNVAIDYVADLEKREVSVFGLRPDPVLSTRNIFDGCQPHGAI